MKEKILSLRDEGKTYKEICFILGCSKSTVSYHCGFGQKEKNDNRRKRRRLNIITRRLETFKNRKIKNLKESSRKFQKRTNGNSKIDCTIQETFNIQDILHKFGEHTKCYISGKKINLLLDENYSFDHIVPISKGGNNSFDNLGIVHETVNYIKHNLTIDELLNWSKVILEYNGYIVNKIPT